MIRAFLIAAALILGTLSAEAAARFWVGGTGTWDASNTASWAATSGGAGGQSVPGAGDTVTFDANSGSGTVTVDSPNGAGVVTVTSITMGAFTGTLDFAANDNNVTLSTFSATGSATKTLNMGDGTWTITNGGSTVWDCTTCTNLTLNANSSTLVFASTQSVNKSYPLGGKTFNNIAITNATNAAFLNDFASAGNFTVSGTFTLNGNVRLVRLGASQTVTITGAWTWDGAQSATNVLINASGTATVSVGAANTLSWLSIQQVTKSGAGSITVNNGFDAGGNTSVTINAPSGGGNGQCIGC